MYCSSPSLIGENCRFRRAGYWLESFVGLVGVVMGFLFGAYIVTRRLRSLQHLVCLVALVCLVYLIYPVCRVYSVCLVCLVELHQPENQINQIDQIDQSDLFFFWLFAAGPSAHYHQGEDGQTQEPEARPAIGGIGEFDEVG